MKMHPYWGNVEEDWAGFAGDRHFNSAYFDNKDFTVFLGEEYDDEGEEIEHPPADDALAEYQRTYAAFINQLDDVVKDIKQSTFEYYLNIYAPYFENSDKSGSEPLNINSKEKHFEQIKDILYLRVLKDGTIKISIHYNIDTEHGIEIRLRNNRVEDIQGIAET